MTAVQPTLREEKKRGRKLKTREERHVTAIRLPETVNADIAGYAQDLSISRSDLGGWLLLRGFNALRAEQGLPPLPLPAYLAKVEHDVLEIGLNQEPLPDEEGILAAS